MRLGRLDDLGRVELRPGHYPDAKHVLRGEITPWGEATGFHHLPSRGDGARIVPGSKSIPILTHAQATCLKVEAAWEGSLWGVLNAVQLVAFYVEELDELLAAWEQLLMIP